MLSNGRHVVSVKRALFCSAACVAQVWQHIDGGSCPGQGIGVRARLDSGISGFIHIKNLSDKQVKNVEDKVQVRCGEMR